MRNLPANKIVVLLSPEELEFAVRNCDENIILGLQMLQTSGSRDLAEKIVDLNQNFKALKDALVAAVAESN